MRNGKLAFESTPHTPRLPMITVEQAQQYSNSSQQSLVVIELRAGS
jgi:hypothetical protein